MCLVAQSCLTLQPCRLLPSRLLYPWYPPDKNTGVSSHSLLQGIFLMRGSNLGHLYCQAAYFPSEPPGITRTDSGQQFCSPMSVSCQYYQVVAVVSESVMKLTFLSVLVWFFFFNEQKRDVIYWPPKTPASQNIQQQFMSRNIIYILKKGWVMKIILSHQCLRNVNFLPFLLNEEICYLPIFFTGQISRHSNFFTRCITEDIMKLILKQKRHLPEINGSDTYCLYFYGDIITLITLKQLIS